MSSQRQFISSLYNDNDNNHNNNHNNNESLSSILQRLELNSLRLEDIKLRMIRMEREREGMDGIDNIEEIRIDSLDESSSSVENSVDNSIENIIENNSTSTSINKIDSTSIILENNNISKDTEKEVDIYKLHSSDALNDINMIKSLNNKLKLSLQSSPTYVSSKSINISNNYYSNVNKSLNFSSITSFNISPSSSLHSSPTSSLKSPYLLPDLENSFLFESDDNFNSPDIYYKTPYIDTLDINTLDDLDLDDSMLGNNICSPKYKIPESPLLSALSEINKRLILTKDNNTFMNMIMHSPSYNKTSFFSEFKNKEESIFDIIHNKTDTEIPYDKEAEEEAIIYKVAMVSEDDDDWVVLPSLNYRGSIMGLVNKIKPDEIELQERHFDRANDTIETGMMELVSVNHIEKFNKVHAEEPMYGCEMTSFHNNVNNSAYDNAEIKIDYLTDDCEWDLPVERIGRFSLISDSRKDDDKKDVFFLTSLKD